MLSTVAAQKLIIGAVIRSDFPVVYESFMSQSNENIINSALRKS